jgi:hypothetical protein
MLLLTLALACAPEPAVPLRSCNGHPELCERSLTDITMALTHNAMSNADEGWLLPNQHHSIDQQLADGVRGFMLDAHYEDGEAMLCHGECSLGSEPLAHGMARYADFLDQEPDNVFVFVFESYVAPADIAGAFEEAGLADRAYAHTDPDAPWPTLATLVDAGTPLVVFSQDDGGDFPWLMSAYADHLWDTPYAAQTADDFSCDLLRGSKDHALFLVNHFLSRPSARPDLAEEVNYDPLLSERVAQCEDEADQRANIIAVDFYDIGDVLTVVDRLNGVGD